MESNHQTFLKVFNNLSVVVQPANLEGRDDQPGSPLENFYRLALAKYTQSDTLRELLEEKINQDLARCIQESLSTDEPVQHIKLRVVMDSVYVEEHPAKKVVKNEGPPPKRLKLSVSNSDDISDDSDDESGDQWDISWKATWKNIKTEETMFLEKSLCNSLIGMDKRIGTRFLMSYGYELSDMTFSISQTPNPNRIIVMLNDEGLISDTPMPMVN